MSSSPDGWGEPSCRVFAAELRGCRYQFKETRDLWVLDTAKLTLDRIDAFAKEQYPPIDPSLFWEIAYDALAQIRMENLFSHFFDLKDKMN